MQKGTNWQWANESPLSPSCAQLPPRSPPSHPPSLSLPLLLLPLFTPPPPVLPPSHFLLILPLIDLFTPVPFLLTMNQAVIKLAVRHAKVICFLILTGTSDATAMSLGSFCLTQCKRQQIISREPELNSEQCWWEWALSEATLGVVSVVSNCLCICVRVEKYTWKCAMGARINIRQRHEQSCLAARASSALRCSVSTEVTFRSHTHTQCSKSCNSSWKLLTSMKRELQSFFLEL